MYKNRKYILPIVLLFIAFSCAKEYSYEGGLIPSPIVDSAARVNSVCTNTNVVGNFTTGDPLTAIHRIELQVNVLQKGYYSFKTDTVNGYSFSGSGVFNNTGMKAVVLQGIGTPVITGNNQFRVTGNGLLCNATVSVGSIQNNAAFTLLSGSGTCLGSNLAGTYIVSALLNATNTLTLSINVTRVGRYSISTGNSNGISFFATGTFTNTGVQQIVLQGSGIPINTGSFFYSYLGVPGACTFMVDVTSTFTDDYFPRTNNSNWTYEIDNNPTDTARFFVNNNRLSAAGNSYHIFMVATGTTTDSSGYYRRSGNEYYRYMDIGDFIGFNAPLWGEYKFLDVGQPVGGNWKSNVYNGMVTIAGFPPQPMIVRFSITLLQKNISLLQTVTTGTVTYNNVMVVEEKYEQLQGSSWVDITSQVGSFKKYYAKDIGMIKYEALNGVGQVTASVKLKRYAIF